MYWFDTATEQSTSASAATNISLLGITGIAGFRGYVRRLQCGPNTNATDVQVRIRLQRTTTLLTAGTGITPLPAAPDGPAANGVVTTLPTAGAFNAVPSVQLAFNTRGHRPVVCDRGRRSQELHRRDRAERPICRQLRADRFCCRRSGRDAQPL